MSRPDAPSPAERARGAGARALQWLPEPALRALAGPPDTVDGQTFDAGIQAILRLNPRDGDEATTVRTDPQAARARFHREIVAIRGTPTAVGSVEDLTVDGADGRLAARLYRPAGLTRPPLTVYFHGGGFVEGDLDTTDELCRVLCRQAGHAVLSIDYRLAPEHPFPAAADDAIAAFRWAQGEGLAGTVAVAGDSAGGNLAAVVAQQCADDAPPVAQLLIYPATDTPTWRPSRDLFDGYLLPDALRAAFFETYADGADPTDPRLSPMYGRLAGLAPALVVTAGFDVLRDEGEAYARALRAAGTPTDLYRQPSLPHGFAQLTPINRASRRATVALARHWRQFVAGL
ncbi:alpha/beta hydrolase [Rubrivirga sp. IMCC45206]|uniref:alpha/beta hydrolase n=1 Tax=Rubrivirga sp. IMCC45206 TaxID=3391614 RepID=UPI00398FEE54